MGALYRKPAFRSSLSRIRHSAAALACARSSNARSRMHVYLAVVRPRQAVRRSAFGLITTASSPKPQPLMWVAYPRRRGFLSHRANTFCSVSSWAGSRVGRTHGRAIRHPSFGHRRLLLPTSCFWRAHRSAAASHRPGDGQPICNCRPDRSCCYIRLERMVVLDLAEGTTICRLRLLQA